MTRPTKFRKGQHVVYMGREYVIEAQTPSRLKLVPVGRLGLAYLFFPRSWVNKGACEVVK